MTDKLQKIRILNSPKNGGLSTRYVERFVDIANKYTDLRELTPEVLRTFIERIIIHERTAKHSKTATQRIDIYFRYIGKLAPEEVA